MEFAKKLQRLMTQRGESQRGLADSLGVSHRSVGGWIEGAEPRGQMAKRLAEHFRVTIDELFDPTKDLPFEQHLKELRGTSEQAQAAYPGNPDAQQLAFDLEWERKQRKRNADKLRKVITDLAGIAYDLDSSDDRFFQIAQSLRHPVEDEARRVADEVSARENLAALNSEAAEKVAGEKKVRKPA